MVKKGQAALEFLMTYGWAILVVLVVIGALAYFGVLNPDWLVPEKCTVVTGISCNDYQVSASGDYIKINLGNGLGKDIEITDVNATWTEGTEDKNCGYENTGGDLLQNGKTKTFTLSSGDCGDITLDGRKHRFDLVIKYYFRGSADQLSHVVKGELLAEPQ